MAEPHDRAGTDPWKASWSGHRREQLTAGLAATPAQRLAWLEEMIDLAFRTGAPPHTTPAEPR